MRSQFVVFTGLLLACFTHSGIIPQLRAYVRVRNDHWLEQVVYANCGSRIRTGVAGGNRETLLRVPRECFDREVVFTTDPIGSNEVSRSDGIALVAGDVLTLHIPAFYNGYLFLSR